MRKSDLGWVAGILFIAAAIRVWAPWDDVLGTSRVNFLESDAWYHVRLVENQVRNFPHRVTTDPYAAPGGQYVAVAPLLDTLIATAVVVTQGRDASVRYIEQVAAIMPAVVGVLGVGAVWALATLAFDRRAGLIAALLAAIFPGHFLDRSLIGFVDHHALEVLLSFATLAALVWSLQSASALTRFALTRSLTAGVLLGLYLLAWASGAYFVAILAVWVALAAVICAPDQTKAVARTAVITGATALIVVLLFQDPGLFRYNTQVGALAGFLAVSIAVRFANKRLLLAVGAPAAVGMILLGAALLLTPGLVQQVRTDLNRFLPNATRMAVLEARPLFLYSGNWQWSQPWIFFRSGFFVGAAALVGLSISLWRTRRADHLLIIVFTAVNYAATVGQNRFGYYLVPATAVVCGWLATVILDWGRVPHLGNPTPNARGGFAFQREVAVILIAGVIIAPNIVPAAITTTRTGGMPEYWFSAMEWLRQHTPEPFGSADYYYARYQDSGPRASFSIMNWWDQGYWVVQTARRVPVANPTQGGATTAARFFTATDENEAIGLMREQHARFVLVDWELPFREGVDRALAGRFQNLADWAGIPTSRYYTLCFARSTDFDPWQPVWIFHEAYYQSMVYRLMVLGGEAVNPSNNSWVVQTQDRVDTTGRRFCELVSRTQHASADEAKLVAAQRGAGFRAAGLTPWHPAFPAAAVQTLKEVASFRDPGQKSNESPMVRIYELSNP